jgi:hypothetical protein
MRPVLLSANAAALRTLADATAALIGGASATLTATQRAEMDESQKPAAVIGARLLADRSARGVREGV